MLNEHGWEVLGCCKKKEGKYVDQRIKVEGGWVVMGSGGFLGLTFITDPKHQWDGYSLNHRPSEAFNRRPRWRC